MGGVVWRAGQASVNIPYHNKALPKGTILREWELEDVLGVGGFGIVYRGKGVYFGEEVAIKEYFPSAISDRIEGTTVAPTDSSSEEIYALGLQKFLEEAKVLWGLSKPERHPNIVNVRSLFEIHGTAYMVMDFERGMSLSQMLKEGRKFDQASLIALLRPIAEGLGSAHRAGVVHRDIKPANILVDENGRPVLIDFGSARFESGQATNTKVTFYTPPYAAIEQYVKSFPQGPWTDIYALGVVLYQCITGEKPLEVLERMHGDQDRRLSERQWLGFSPTFIRAIDAAMAFRPVERPQSIPAWLALFDGKAAPPVDEEATRIGGRMMDSPTLAAAPIAAPVVAAVAATPAATPREAPSGTSRRRPWLLWGVTALALLAAAGLAARFFPQQQTAPATTAAAPANVAIKDATVTPPAANPIEGEAAGLLADAKHSSRPAREIAALTDADSKIAALADQIKNAGPAADAPAKTAPLLAQMNDLAAEMAHGEANALSRAGRALARDMVQPGSQPTAADAVAAIAAANKAKTDLDTAIAAVLKVPDAARH